MRWPFIVGNMVIRIIAPIIFASAVLFMAPFMAVNASAADLAGHRAAYAVHLSAAASDSDVVRAEGTVQYRFEPTCKGWMVENRTRLAFGLINGRTIGTEWLYAAFESKDGSLMRFQTRDRRNGTTIEALRGTLRLAPDGSGRAALDLPKETDIPVPPGTLSPTRHLQDVFRMAAAGKRHVTHVVFDGTTLDNPLEISAVIRPGNAEERRTAAADTGLAERPVWDIRFAFFPYAAQQAQPIYEMEVMFRDDGIAHWAKQDYGDFVLDLRLEHLELIPQPHC